MNTIFFKKRSIGMLPLASKRDWTVFWAIVIGVLALREVALLFFKMDDQLVRSMSIGACIGMLPSLLMCLPVTGVVDALSRDALPPFLKWMKFSHRIESGPAVVYTQDSPSWMSWDSNRMTIVPLSGGQLSVSMPLYCYLSLKRWS